MKPHSTIPGEQLDVLIYAILAFCCAVVLAGAAWIALDGAREGCCRCAPDDDLERASAAAAAEDEERERLIPEGCEYTYLLPTYACQVSCANRLVYRDTLLCVYVCTRVCRPSFFSF